MGKRARAAVLAVLALLLIGTPAAAEAPITTAECALGGILAPAAAEPPGPFLEFTAISGEWSCVSRDPGGLTDHGQARPVVKAVFIFEAMPVSGSRVRATWFISGTLVGQAGSVTVSGKGPAVEDGAGNLVANVRLVVSGDGGAWAGGHGEGECSCTVPLADIELGSGHIPYGCETGAMRWWVGEGP